MNKLTNTDVSLSEVHDSVETDVKGNIWRRLFAFLGPAYLVSVGYMDPGNWATDLAGGSRFGYKLLWVLVMSNLIALLLQSLSARLGVVARRDLAQASRELYHPVANIFNYILAEIAIAACDLAEVVGMAIGLQLLFHIPLVWGVSVSVLDTFLVLFLMHLGIRKLEAFILGLVVIIGGAFAVQMFLAKPAPAELIVGFIPSIPNSEALFIAIGIIGATVMPHNLYLHSALVQTRRIGVTMAEKRTACRFNLVDSLIALNGALVVNAAILILAGTVFFKRGIIVTEIQQAHELLTPVLGTTIASVLFAVALLCSGQSSTLTGTLAGQIVMEGFVNLRVRPWLRRFVTRMLAVVPAVLTIWLAGDKGTYQLLIFSQVILSLQLPFAVIPLVQFTSDRERMGEFQTKPLWRIVAWVVAAVIVVLNVRLFSVELASWTKAAGMWIWLIAGPVLLGLTGLLAWIVFQPVLPARLRNIGRAPVRLPEAAPAPEWTAPVYRNILVPLDHSDRDADAINHAASLARAHSSKVHLLHVEEGVTSQVFGEIASTAEVESGQRYFERILAGLRAQGIEAELHVSHGVRPKAAIIETAERLRPDLIVMGAHGHRGIQDLALGRTIDSVRHHVDVPLLVVRTEKKP